MLNVVGITAAAGTDGWGHMDGWGGGWMWLWGVAMMALFVVLSVWLIRSTSGSGAGSTSPQYGPREQAREILAERYAKGELTTDEYRERVKELQ